VGKKKTRIEKDQCGFGDKTLSENEQKRKRGSAKTKGIDRG